VRPPRPEVLPDRIVPVLDAPETRRVQQAHDRRDGRRDNHAPGLPGRPLGRPDEEGGGLVARVRASGLVCVRDDPDLVPHGYRARRQYLAIHTARVPEVVHESRALAPGLAVLARDRPPVHEQPHRRPDRHLVPDHAVDGVGGQTPHDQIPAQVAHRRERFHPVLGDGRLDGVRRHHREVLPGLAQEPGGVRSGPEGVSISLDADARDQIGRLERHHGRSALGGDVDAFDDSRHDLIIMKYEIFRHKNLL